MSRRSRVLLFVAIGALAVAGTLAYAWRDLDRYQDRIREAPAVAQTPAASVQRGPRVLFRNTAIGDDYGLVAMVPLTEPDGPRAMTELACDRIDATATGASCLYTRRGVATRFEWRELGPDLAVTGTWPLAGLPSRTRLSDDGALVASTSFVAGHSYMQAGFSTATEIRRTDGDSYGNLERFDLFVDGRPVSPVDRNIWGVTFADDDDTFYATVATGGTEYLARGDLSERTLTTIRAGVECPSLSPDGTRVAFKRDVGTDGVTHWAVAVLDLAKGTEQVLDGETASVDDQIEWLDDDTLLYGLPRPEEPGVTDVWALDVDPAARPRLFIEQAWSPTVVRG